MHCSCDKHQVQKVLPLITVTAGMLDAKATQVWLDQAAKVFQHIGRSVVGYLDNYAVPFAHFVPAFLQVRCVGWWAAGSAG